jgi:hypothetical protein
MALSHAAHRPREAGTRGSMWCAYVFAAFVLISLPAAIRAGTAAIVAWVAQTFPSARVALGHHGRPERSGGSGKRSEATDNDASATLHEVAHVQEHLAAQDVLLTRIAEKIRLNPVPIIDAPAPEKSLSTAHAGWCTSAPCGKAHCATPLGGRPAPPPSWPT